METAFNAYLEALLFSTVPLSADGEDCADDRTLDQLGFTRADFDPETLAALRADFEEFTAECEAACEAAGLDLWADGIGFEDFGRDAWFTRTLSGRGFWDGGWPEPLAGILTRCAKSNGAPEFWGFDVADDVIFQG